MWVFLRYAFDLSVVIVSFLLSFYNLSMLEKLELECAPLGRTIPLHIHLPENYYESQDRYPVFYMFDGHNLFEDEQATFGESWHLEDFLNGYEKEMIIVGLECDHQGQNRLQEYCPYVIESKDQAYFAPADGRGMKLLTWMVEELKPFIDERYRTYPFREATGIGGSSMGGLMAFAGVLHFNEIFSKAACLSPSFAFCPESVLEEIEKARSNSVCSARSTCSVYSAHSSQFAFSAQSAHSVHSVSPMNPDTRLYLSFGENEIPKTSDSHYERFVNGSLAVIEALLALDVPVKFILQQQGNHSEHSWSLLNSDYMDFLWLE